MRERRWWERGCAWWGRGWCRRRPREKGWGEKRSEQRGWGFGRGRGRGDRRRGGGEGRGRRRRACGRPPRRAGGSSRPRGRPAVRQYRVSFRTFERLTCPLVSLAPVFDVNRSRRWSAYVYCVQIWGVCAVVVELDAVRSRFELDAQRGGRRGRPARSGQCQLDVATAVDAEVEGSAAVEHVCDGEGVAARSALVDVVDRDVVGRAVADVSDLLSARAGRATGDHGRAGEGVAGGFGLDVCGAASAVHAVHGGGVGGDGGADGAGGGGGGAGPQVGEGVAGGAGFADRGGGGGDGGRGAVLVEQGDGDIAVGQGFGQHVQAAGGGDHGALPA